MEYRSYEKCRHKMVEVKRQQVGGAVRRRDENVRERYEHFEERSGKINMRQ